MPISFSFADFLTNSITIKRPVRNEDDGGVAIGSTTTVVTSQPCSLQPTAQMQVDVGGQTRIPTTHVAYCESAIAIVNGDLAVDENGDTYLVKYWKHQGGKNNLIGEVFAIYMDAITE